jgi:hypothetical protein
VTRAFANQIQFSLKRVSGKIGTGGDEDLLDVRCRLPGGGTKIRLVRICRDDAPTNETLAFRLTEPADGLLAALTLSGIGRKKYDSSSKFPRLRKFGSELLLRDSREK